MGAFLLFLSLLLAQQTPAHAGEGSMIWPVDESRDLSATFCEYRPGHYHAGIDLAFGGRMGLPVRAVASGHVDHVRSSRTGYGNVIYLRHGDGRMSVYAHLESFAEPLQSMIELERERRERYDVQIYPAEPVRYAAGEIIAYGGASGTSAPHLHLEIRDTNNQLLNPITFFREAIQDNIRPVAETVLIEPLDSQSLLGGEPWPVAVDARDAGRTTIIPAEGRFRFSVRGYDLQGAMRGKLGLYRVALVVEGDTIYDLSYDRASWERGNEIGLTYRLEATGLGPTRYTHRLYGEGIPIEVLRGSGDLYSGVVDLSGLPEGEKRDVSILLEDAYANTRWIHLRLKKESGVLPAGASYLEGRRIPFGDGFMEVDSRAGVFRFRTTARAGGNEFQLVDSTQQRIRRIEIQEAGGSLTGAFDLEGLSSGDYLLHDGQDALILPLVVFSPEGSNLLLRSADEEVEIFSASRTAFYPECLTLFPVENAGYPQEEGMEMVVSPYCSLPEGTPTTDSFNIRIRAPRERRQDSSLGIYAWDSEAGRWRFAGNERQGDRLSVRVRSLGLFAVLADHHPPRVVSSLPADGARLEAPSEIVIRFDDVGSGVDGDRVVVQLDGRPLPGYYDPYKTTYFSNGLDRIDRGEHVIHVEAYDRAENSTGIVAIDFTVR